MATAEELTDPYLSTYTPVPKAAPGVCHVCHSATNPGWNDCMSCERTVRGVSRPTRLVVPISLTKVPTSVSGDDGGQFHDVLRIYKYGHNADVRSRMELQVSAVLTRFLRAHTTCIVEAAGEAWDYITVTPSTRNRTGPHPLELAIQRSADLAKQYRTVLQPGAQPIAGRESRDDGFVPTADVSGGRFLIVDDTFTSGARTQSAASALQLAGARVVAILPIGRVVDPAFSDAAGELWRQARATRFDFGVCCLDH
jgi:hypothetical protein